MEKARPDVAEIAGRAYVAVDAARAAPPGQAAAFWLEAEELFFGGFLAMGRTREQVTAEVESDVRCFLTFPPLFAQLS